VRHGFTALLLIALTAGCSGGDTPPASGPPSASGGVTVSVDQSAMSVDPSATEDVPGTTACAALASAINDGTLMQAGVVDAIVADAGPADAPIADAAERLGTAYRKARASAGTQDEPDAVAGVSEAGADMSNVCGESGLDTVG
jgi:hypothetical protein